MIEIPCTPGGVATWTQRTALDGRDYVLAFRWNQRAGAWTLDLADQDGAAILLGRTLVAGYPLLKGVTDTRRPPGELAVLDAFGLDDLDPAFSDLGTRFVLVYVTAAELA